MELFLRHVSRHLTAYDLVQFHHQGANYPDALLLDAVLHEYLLHLERRPDLFAASDEDREPLRSGESADVGVLCVKAGCCGGATKAMRCPMRRLRPARTIAFYRRAIRVPEEQIAQPARCWRRLFADHSLRDHLKGHVAELLRQSLRDLEHFEEWREMGLGVFLDRPLGVGKAATEPDDTLLLSAEAFSFRIACTRLSSLEDDLGVERRNAYAPLPGLPLAAIGGPVVPAR